MGHGCPKHHPLYTLKYLFSKMSRPIITQQPGHPEPFKRAQAFSHVILDTEEHILIHRVGKNMWAALNSNHDLVPIAENDFSTMPSTHNLSFCISNESGLIAVPPLDDMVRQLFEYNWTNGIAFQGTDVWNWDILKQEWKLNGCTYDMAIATRCGTLLMHSSRGVQHKCARAKLCSEGHWNTVQSNKCKHCKVKI